jgi:hypothetical protein
MADFTTTPWSQPLSGGGFGVMPDSKITDPRGAPSGRSS